MELYSLKLLESFEHKGYFYSRTDKKELLTAKKFLKTRKKYFINSGFGLLGKPCALNYNLSH